MSLEPVIGIGTVLHSKGEAVTPAPVSWSDARIVFDHRNWICAGAEINWIADHHLLILTEHGRTDRTVVRFDDDVVFDGRDRPGALTFVPAGTRREGEYHNARLAYSALWIDTALHETMTVDRDALRGKGFANGRDTVIATLLNALHSEIAAGSVPDTAYVQHMASLILLRLAGAERTASPRRSARLPAKVLARVDDHIRAHLGDSISLEDLAAAANLHADSFARRFKATTGLAPYAYVLEKRISEAETLLRRKDAEIGAIAAMLGFSSQSHFTTTFRRLRGTTPKDWRRNFLPRS